MKHPRLFLMLSIILLGISTSSCSSVSEEVGDLRTAIAEYGTIHDSIIVTGKVTPLLRAELQFSQPGMVEEVFVDINDTVTAGDLLAVLEMDDVVLAVAQAEANLRIQQLMFEEYISPPSEAEIAVARAAVNSALASYNAINQPPDPERVASAEMQVEQSYLQYLQLQNSLEDQWAAPDSVTLPLSERVEQSLIGVEIARLQLAQLQNGPDGNSLAAASAGVMEAQSRLDAILAPPSELSIQRMEIQLRQAEIDVNKAMKLLEERMLYAPFSGRVAAVNIRENNIAPSGIPAVTLIDDRAFQLEIQIDELDVARVSEGLPVAITFDALPGVIVNGQVESVSMVSEQTSTGVVTYKGIVLMEEAPQRLLSGFTGIAEVFIQTFDNVLLVPNWAVRFDRDNGKAYVSVFQESGELIETEIGIGLQGQEYVEVISGLTEGQVVAVSLTPSDLDVFGGLE